MPLLLVLALLLVWSEAAHAQQFCAPRTLSYGAAPTTSTIGSAGEVGCFRFTGAAGQRVRVRAVETSGTLVADLNVGGADCVPARHGLTCTLTAGGVHSVTVGGTGTGDYAVSVQRLDAPVGCSSLTYANATRTGAISPGEAECWRFLSNDGARLRVRVVTAAAALEPLVEVLRPDGTTRCIPTFADDSTCVLDLDGTHTLLVNDAGGATGGYSISIQRLNGPAGCPFKGFGATATLGTLATTGETDCFSVQGAVGNALRVRLLSNTIDPTTEILRPDGTTRCAPSALENRTCFLDTDGLHFVLVRDGAATNTGNYRISFQRLDDPLGCDVAPFGPIALSTAIATWGETDCYRFNVPVGSRVRARLLPDVGQLNPHAELIAPDGTTSCAPAFADKFTCPTIAAGVHTLLVRDARLGAGNYRLALQRLQSPIGCGTLAFGPTLVPAALSTPMETDCWRITAAAGDQLRLEGAVAASAHVEVVRPDGTTRCQFPGQSNTTCALDTSGTHTVLIEHEDPAQTGGYALLAQRLNDPVGCEWLTVDDAPRAGSIPVAGGLNCYRVDAGRWEHLRIQLTGSGGLSPTAEVVRPDGTRRCAPEVEDFFTCVTDTAGTHTILVTGGVIGRTGDYELDLRPRP